MIKDCFLLNQIYWKFWQVFVLKCKLDQKNAFVWGKREAPKFQNNTTELFWAYDGKYYHYKII